MSRNVLSVACDYHTHQGDQGGHQQGEEDAGDNLESFESSEFESELIELEQKFTFGYCHSLQAKLFKASVLVVVAGMEGALTSVVAGMVDKPVIGVPTSIGYGTNLQGIAPLLGMLNSCAAGVTVVNIDNGFGAGFAAALINRI